MKVAVIIVNYNDTQDTIEYVKKISEYKTINRIVVVDNMSTTIGTFEKLKELESKKTTVLQSDKNGGYGYGNNFGIRYLKSVNEEYDYIIISNPDIDIEENAIRDTLKVLEEDEKIVIAAPRMYNKNNNPIRRSSWKTRTFGLDVIHSTRVLELLFYKTLRNGEYKKEEYENEKLEVEAISGAFFIAKLNVFEKIGMFDENVFLFYEEDIIGKKIKELGYKTYSLNNIKFIHYESQTIGKTFSYYAKVKQLYKSKMYYQKEYNKINKFQMTIFSFLNLIRKLELLVEIPIRKILKK